ncbi:MAG: hypothetical protein WBG90_14850 [Saonia sp.]
MQFVQDLNTAYAKGNANFILVHASKDIVRYTYGVQKIEGKDAFSKAIHKMKNYVTDEITVHSIIAHGREASSNGKIKMGGRTYAFCDVYHFVNKRCNVVKEMHTYVVAISSK